MRANWRGSWARTSGYARDREAASAAPDLLARALAGRAGRGRALGPGGLDPSVADSARRHARPPLSAELCERPRTRRRALRFGIGPRLAGESGAGQTVPLTKEIPAKRDAALLRLKGRRFFAVRLNRLFSADGGAGSPASSASRIASRASAWRSSFRSATTPPAGRRRHRQVAALRAPGRADVRPEQARDRPADHERGEHHLQPQHLGRRVPGRARGARRGVVTAKRTSRALGYRHQKIGFNYAWRFGDANDAGFWDRLGRDGGATLRRHTDWVGLDIYPGTYVPGPGGGRRSRRRLPRGHRPDARVLHAQGGFGGPCRFASRRPGGHRAGAHRGRAASAVRHWSGPRTATAAPTTSPTSAGSGCATTTAAGPTSSRSSGCCATTTAPSPASTPTARLVARYGARRARQCDRRACLGVRVRPR